MKTLSKKTFVKVMLITALIAVASTCFTAGTFAALSADYVWQSAEVPVGSFEFSDSTYSFNLFGDKTEIYPGDSGSCKLSGPNFGNYSVGWSFLETNADGIPTIYYIENNGEIACMYSSYDFTALSGLYFKLGENHYPFANVSGEIDVFAASLEVGATVGWCWPDSFFTLENQTYSADNSSAPVTAFRDYSEALCLAKYGFKSSAAGFLNANSIVAYATESLANGYRATFSDSIFEVKDGRIYRGGQLVPVCDGVFRLATPVDRVSSVDYIVGFIPVANRETLVSSAQTAGLKIELSDMTYSMDMNAGQMIQKSDGSGNRLLVKLYADAVSQRPKVQVTIKAVVTA